MGFPRRLMPSPIFSVAELQGSSRRSCAKALVLLTNDCFLRIVSCLLACLGYWPCEIPFASLGREGLLISDMGALDVHVSVLFLDLAWASHCV